MDLKYDIYTIKNSQGTGENRQYVRLVQHEPMTDKELEAAIQNRCSLTKGDVAAVLRELHGICVQAFSMGRRVHIPELGYFSLAASLEMQRISLIEGLRVRRYVLPASTSVQSLRSWMKWREVCTSSVPNIPRSLPNIRKRNFWRKSRNIWKRIVSSPLVPSASFSA